MEQQRRSPNKCPFSANAYCQSKKCQLWNQEEQQCSMGRVTIKIDLSGVCERLDRICQAIDNKGGEKKKKIK